MTDVAEEKADKSGCETCLDGLPRRASTIRERHEVGWYLANTKEGVQLTLKRAFNPAIPSGNCFQTRHPNHISSDLPTTRTYRYVFHSHHAHIKLELLEHYDIMTQGHCNMHQITPQIRSTWSVFDIDS